MDTEKLRMAGLIIRKLKDEIGRVVGPDTSVLELAAFIESRIRELGAEIAFPVNISFDEDAAHDTPSPDDKRTIGHSLVKIDIGAHIDGFIADSAISISFSDSPEHKDLIKAAEAALDRATKAAKPGTTIGEIGEIIEDEITRRGFRPVSNLTGHGLGRYEFHAEPQIFNIRNNSRRELEYGDVIAIEPFATNGEGRVKEISRAEIFSLAREIPVRDREERRIMSHAVERKGLPFSRRDVYSSPLTNIALSRLVSKGALYTYPVLREEGGGLVSQAEHTIIVLDSPEVLT